MKFTRGKRIALEVLGPPALGTMVMAGIFIIASLSRGGGLGILRQEARDYLFMLVPAYVFAGPPSILYAVIMEWRIREGLDPASWRLVGWSSFLGLLAGLAIPLVLSSGHRTEAEIWLTFCSTGMLVGLVMGLLIRCFSLQPTRSVA